MTYKIHNGNSAEILKQYPDNSIDAIVTDPPYLIGFLGKEWDHKDNRQLDVYQECLRVLKPGGHILAFSAARTYHYLAITLEQAGFEVRDQIMWIYSSGFPKSQDVGRQIQKKLGVKEKRAYKEGVPRIGGDGVFATDTGQVICTDLEAKKWEGWGHSLKPGHEPICLARKPLKQSIAKNVQQYGTGALNIDATRVPNEDRKALKGGPAKVDIYNVYANVDKSHEEITTEEWQGSDLGRFPSNVIGEIDGYQKFFYCPKVSRKERHIGFGEPALSVKEMLEEMGGYFIDNAGNKQEAGGKSCWLPHTGNIYMHGIKNEYLKWCKDNNKTPGLTGNNHPTVKPVNLMKYLVKLITPPGGTVLDPFNGSGSTGMAATELGFDYIGCELDPEYVKISERRIAAWLSTQEPIADNNFDDLFQADTSKESTQDDK